MEIRRPTSTKASLRNWDAWTHHTTVVGGLSAAFLGLLLVVTQAAPTSFDRWLIAEIQSFAWGEFAFVPRLGSDIGGGVFGLYVAPAAAAAAFVTLRRWRLLVLLLAVYALHLALISPKLFVTAHRPSPGFGVEGVGGLHSFPSGHVQWATSFYGFLAYLAWRVSPPRLRPLVLLTYAGIVIGAMLGRIELGKHWPIDTLAGVLAGLIALRLIIALDARERPFSLPAAVRRRPWQRIEVA